MVLDVPPTGLASAGRMGWRGFGETVESSLHRGTSVLTGVGYEAAFNVAPLGVMLMLVEGPVGEGILGVLLPLL